MADRAATNEKFVGIEKEEVLHLILCGFHSPSPQQLCPFCLPHACTPLPLHSFLQIPTPPQPLADSQGKRDFPPFLSWRVLQKSKAKLCDTSPPLSLPSLLQRSILLLHPASVSLSTISFLSFPWPLWVAFYLVLNRAA